MPVKIRKLSAIMHAVTSRPSIRHELASLAALIITEFLDQVTCPQQQDLLEIQELKIAGRSRSSSVAMTIPRSSSIGTTLFSAADALPPSTALTASAKADA